ncbi:MAG: HNH endonuclease [Anaerolinea sp.]|nr:HNH endonuclease [Anaerolinea sp.]
MSVYIPASLKRQVREQYANCCAYCHTNEELTVAIFEVEHIVPLTAGGETALDNLCLSCPTCNWYKVSRLTAVDPQTNTTAPLYNPQQEQWPDHFSWNEDKTELIGLTPSGRATILVLRMNRPQLIRVRRMWVKMGEHPPLLHPNNG